MSVSFPGQLPVDSGDRTASAHAQWLRDAAEAVESMKWLLYQLTGGRDGVVGLPAVDGADSLNVVATSPVSMSVTVSAGAALLQDASGKIGVYTQEGAWTSSSVTAPSTNDRIDLVQLNLAELSVEIKTGTEAASPTVPVADTECLALAEIYLRSTSTSIKDTDDSTNGYITDKRTFANA